MHLTDKQEKVLAFLQQYIAAHGQGPSTREITAQFGFRSQTAAVTHLRALERKGRISREPYVPRSISIL